MESLKLQLDPSIQVKFRILDHDNQVKYSGSNKWFADFWDTFLGWIVSLPNVYQFENGTVLHRQLSSMKIVFDGKTANHHFHALINNPSLNRGGKKRASFVHIDDQSYEIYRGQRGNYFSLFNDQEKVFAMKKNHHERDTFEAVFEEEKMDSELAAMVMIALADSI